MATNNNSSSTKKKSTTSTSAKGPTKADLEAQIALLQAQLALAQAQAQAAASAPTAPAAPAINLTAPSTDVTVVYCSDSLGYAKISNMELHFTRYGETFVMSRSQFDELVGKYRRWFDIGILAVSEKDIKIAAEKRLRVDTELGLDAATLDSIGGMSAAQLDSLWGSLSTPAQKTSVITFYKKKFIEGAAGFADREKIDLLDRLTNGGFRREQDEMSGRWKIRQTEM